ncbi:hypothetical protein FALCPG4_000994 [Fusarium falciforme]
MCIAACSDGWLMHWSTLDNKISHTVIKCFDLNKERATACLRKRPFLSVQKIIKVDADMDTVYGTDGVTLRPSHEWYHAMDRNSYSWQGGCGALESCENQACRNYYNLTAVSRHYWRPDISRNCGCERESVDG